MTTARLVPVTVEMDGDELDAEDAWHLARHHGPWVIAKGAFLRFRFGDGFTNSRALALQGSLAVIPFLLALTGLAADLDQERPAEVVARTIEQVSPGHGTGDALARAVTGPEQRACRRGRADAGPVAVPGVDDHRDGPGRARSNRIYGIRRDRRAVTKYGRTAALTAILAIPLGLGFLLLVAGGSFANTMTETYDWPDGARAALQLALAARTGAAGVHDRHCSTAPRGVAGLRCRRWRSVPVWRSPDKRFGEGDAVRVLGRVERFRDRLQLEVRSLEPAETDPAELVPESRRDVDELDGFFEFLAAEIAHPGLAAARRRLRRRRRLPRRLRILPGDAGNHHAWTGGLLEHTVGVASLCREAAQLHPRLRADIAARGSAPARRGPDTRVRSRAALPPDRGGSAPRSRPSGPAPDRGTRRRAGAGGARRGAPRGLRPSRGPRRPHRRGGGPLPRQSARRGGCHATGDDRRLTWSATAGSAGRR